MPRINPEKMTELLYQIHTQMGVIWELSKNPAITTEAERVKELLERILTTIEEAFSIG
jgi:hypothetical protein